MKLDDSGLVSPAFAKDVSNSFCFLFRLVGVSICTSTIWSPVLPRRNAGMPLPRIRKRRPDCVPGSIVSRAILPANVGTSIVPPSAATVIGTGSSEEKRETILAAGADHVLDPADEGLAAKVKALTDGKGVNVVYDPVGGDLALTATRAIAWNGRYLIIGFASGKIPAFPANHAMIKTYSLIGVRAGESPRRDPELARRQSAALQELAAEGAMLPHISHRFALADTAEALRVLERREAIGRVVVETVPSN